MILSSTPRLRRLMRAERRRQGRTLLAAALSGAVAATAAVGLLGLSGWFITSAAVAGAAGLAVAQAFNYLLPAALIRFLAIVRTVFRYLERICGHQAALAASASLRPQIFAALAAGPLGRALSLSGGEASARMAQDVDALERSFLRTPTAWSAVAGLGAGVGLVAVVEPRAALFLLAVAAADALAARLLNRRSVRVAGIRIQARTGELKDVVAALAPAGAELRAYQLEDWAAEEIDRRGRALGAAKLEAGRAAGAAAVLHPAMTGLCVAGVAIIASPQPAAALALAALAAAMAMEGLSALLRAWGQDGEIAGAAARLEPLLDGHERATPRTPGLTLHIGGRAYPPGSRIALAGPSGSGKTLLVEALLGLRVSLTALQTRRDRSAFAYLPQEAPVLAGTVRENLALGDPDAAGPAMWAALADAALEDYVRGLPEGLDTWVGEGGARLSGGQRRRLALARALLRPAPWLVLDEPTTGLDAATERAVLDGVARRLAERGQGLVLISHSAMALGLCEAQWPAAETALPPQFGATRIAEVLPASAT